MNEFPPRVAKFEKVSLSQFARDAKKQLPGLSDREIEEAYDRIVLPARATAGSSGYDIRTPFSFSLCAGEEITVPTGLRCRMAEGWCLLLMPRSGLGFRLYTRLANTVGNIVYTFSDVVADFIGSVFNLFTGIADIFFHLIGC